MINCVQNESNAIQKLIFYDGTKEIAKKKDIMRNCHHWATQSPNKNQNEADSELCESKR